MSNRKKLMAYFNNESKFNEEEERLRTSLKENTFDCLDLDINHQFPDGTLPIHYACLYNPEIYLSNKNNLPDSLINTPGGPYKCTPMMFTIYNSNYKILLHLLLRGANILIHNSRSSDVLSFCVRYDDLLGLILVLSFLKENISVKRYLRYSWKKDSERTRDFLLKRELEIEGKGINPKSKEPIFTEDKIGCVLSFIFMILCMVFIQSSRLIFSCLFLVLYFISESPIISFIFNIAFNFYSYCLIFNSLSKESGCFIVIGMHLINFLFIQIIKTPYLNIRKIKDSKSFITDMIHADAYNEENFCVTCLNSNIFLDKHCDFCNRCVSNYIYHCPLLNKCITTKNYALFVFYCFTSLIIYILTLGSSYMHTPLYEFIICLFLVIRSLRMFKEFNKVSKKQNKKETIPNSDIIPPSYVSIPIDKI